MSDLCPSHLSNGVEVSHSEASRGTGLCLDHGYTIPQCRFDSVPTTSYSAADIPRQYESTGPQALEVALVFVMRRIISRELTFLASKSISKSVSDKHLESSGGGSAISITSSMAG